MSQKYVVVNRSLGLLRHRKTGIHYFRKYVTGVGRAELSLRTKDPVEAERIIFRTYSQFLRAPRSKERKVRIDEIVADIYEINQGKAESTFYNFEYHCRKYILPYFSGFPIDAVAKEWPRYVAVQHTKNPRRQLGHDRRHVVTILNRAVELELLPGLPRLKLDRAKRIKQPISLYTPAEVQVILSVTAQQIRERYPDNREFHFKAQTLDDLKLKFELGLFSGMRLPMEANQLLYSWIDFNAGTISLPPEITKTRDGRTYPIDPETLKKLWKRYLKAQALWKRRPHLKTDFVFPRRGQRDLPATRSDKSWQRFKRALGLTKKLYWSRHTHATAAVQSGTAETVVKKNMGTSLEMFERVYVRPSPEEFRRQASAVRKRFIGDIPEHGETDV